MLRLTMLALVAAAAVVPGAPAVVSSEAEGPLTS